MGSIDTISSNSSSRDARQEQALGSPFGGQSLPTLHRSISRPFSIMSQSTEQDLLAIAEMLSPTVDATIEEEPIPDAPPMAELESFSDLYFEEPVPSNPRRDSLGSSMSSLYSSYQRDRRTSVYTDSDGGSYMGDDMYDSNLLLPPVAHGHRNLHLPRGSLPMPPLDDSRSLSSATSYSSLRTPSLSRTSSLAYLASPPISPGSSYSPIDAPHSPPHPGPNPTLGIIEESLHSEEDHHHYRHEGTSETLNLHDVLENQGTPAGRHFPQPAFPSSAFNSPQVDSYFDHRTASPRSPSQNDTRSPVNSAYKTESRSASRTEMRSPVHSMYQSDSRSDHKTDLRSPQRGEARADARRSPPPPNPPPSRKLPELHRLQISNGAPSISSAPAPDLTAPSPFRERGPYGSQQSHSAHPTSHRSPRPFAPDQSRSAYGDRRTGFNQDVQTPYSDDEVSFAKLRSPYSTEEFRYPTERTVTHSPSAPSLFAMTRSPTYIPNKLHEDKMQQQKQSPQDRFPPIPPVPLSPVPSMSSGSSAHTNKSGPQKKSSGFGKLFRGNTSDKASKKSAPDGSSVFASNQSVSSFEFGMSKEDAKRAKKEAAKARTERLAQDLAEKARKRAEAAKAAKETLVKEKSKKPWEEGGGLYEGISYF